MRPESLPDRLHDEESVAVKNLQAADEAPKSRGWLKLRSSAKIEYVGDYAKGAPDKSASSPLEVKPSKSPLTGTPASAPEPILPVRPASVPSGNALDKGLKGLK